VRDPALYVIAFTFYAGMNAQLTLEQLALCYLATVTVIVINEVWKSRADEHASLPGDIGRGIKWGSFLFVIGFAWGAACGYILMWMARWAAGLTVLG
jgi:hypothetical protein